MPRLHLSFPILMIIPAIFFSCQSEMVFDEPVLSSIQNGEKPYSEAKNDLFSIWNLVNSTMEDTKSACFPPRIAEASFFSFAGNDTKGGDSVSASIYVVKFEDERGGAILNATYDGPPVFALTEDGSFDISKLRQAMSCDMTNNDTDEVADSSDGVYFFLADLLKTNSRSSKRFKTKSIVLSDSNYSIVSWVSPMVNKMWGQRYPFNQFMPYIAATGLGLNGRAYVGCSAIAAAQMMSYTKHPLFGSISGNGAYWEDFYEIGSNSNYQDFLYNTYDANTDVYEKGLTSLLAEGLRALADDFYSTYQLSGTTTTISNVLFALKAMDNDYYGEAVIKDLSGNMIHLKNMLDSGKPVYIRGSYSSDGHAWVADGYVEVQLGGTLLSDYYLHFNWGWNGKHNGYYSFLSTFAAADRKAYDTYIDPVQVDTDDVTNYNHNVQFIKY